MANFMGLSCPACEKEHGVEIQGLVWVRLMADGTEPVSGTEWTDGSSARCTECGWNGLAGSLRDDDAEGPIPPDRCPA